MNFDNSEVNYFDVNSIVDTIFGESTHKKRVGSMARAALGVIASGSLIVHRIGRGMAEFLNLSDKHAVKQVDRLLSNNKLDVWSSFEDWVQFLVQGRKAINVTMDWTDFDGDNHSTIALNLVTSHGRATPLIWKTVYKNKLKNNRNNYEDEVLSRLSEIVPADIEVTILADRGFCDIKLFEFLTEELGFKYKIRIRGNVMVEDSKGDRRAAIEWLAKNGRAKTIRHAKVTSQEYIVGTVVCTKAKGMKEAWCIVSSEDNISGSEINKWYAKRWGCESQFRDTKDIHFGMGLSATKIRKVERRDRLLLISAIAIAILTILGAAGEKIGLDKYLKVNTVKHRTLSLFKQGVIYFRRIPRMVDTTLEKLLCAFTELIEENKHLSSILGVI